jgi:3-oxoacyl-[acyl-carrier-protein] synthase III
VVSLVRRSLLRIESIALRIPSRKITNADTLAAITELNSDAPRHELSHYLRDVKFLLERSGSDTHYLRDREFGETAHALIRDACTEALASAGILPREIGLLIYCGVGRGFLEPASAYLVARSLGIACECFDVLDACMSWVRALQIAHSFFAAGVYRHILIVNGEFNVYEHGFPELLRGICHQRLRYTFPAFTIGEAATATVVSASAGSWCFRFRSQPERASLCTLPLEAHADFSAPDENLALNGVSRFVSFGHELTCAGLEAIVNFIEETFPRREAIHWWFPHAASSEMCRRAEQRLDLDGRVLYDVFPRFGNLVSASIPAGLKLAWKDGRLERGQRIVLCPVSAGMSLALVDFTF